MTIEVTSGFTAFKAPAAAINTAKPADERPWSARARLGFIMGSALLAWVAVIAIGLEIVRFAAHTLL